jgi:hypothetical protein
MIFFGWNDIYMFFFPKICHVIIVRESYTHKTVPNLHLISIE